MVAPAPDAWAYGPTGGRDRAVAEGGAAIGAAGGSADRGSRREAPLPMAIAMIDTESRLHLGRLRSRQRPPPGRRGAGHSLTSEKREQFFWRRCSQPTCAVTLATLVAVAHIKVTSCPLVTALPTQKLRKPCLAAELCATGSGSECRLVLHLGHARR
jgi:hypothetical protein